MSEENIGEIIKEALASNSVEDLTGVVTELEGWMTNSLSQESRELLEGLLGDLSTGDFLEKCDFEGAASLVMQIATAIGDTLSAESGGGDIDQTQPFLQLSEKVFEQLESKASSSLEYLHLARSTNYALLHHFEDFAKRMVDLAVESALTEDFSGQVFAYFCDTCENEYFKYGSAIENLTGRLSRFCLHEVIGLDPLEQQEYDSWPTTFDSDWGEKTLPALTSFKGLRELDLSCINFSTIPSEIGELVNLESLDLSCNAAAKVLPPEIKNLERLKRLNLEECDSLENIDAIKELEIEELTLPDHLK
jgi:hypothetical protein